MNLAPIFNAAPIVKVHFFAAGSAFILGVLQFAAPKGTVPHRKLGWTWVALMAVMILSSLIIRDRFYWGPFSSNVCLLADRSQTWLLRCATLHSLSVFALLLIPYAILHARRNNPEIHRWLMLVIFMGAVVTAGAFTFQPPRILYSVFLAP